jgi:hypothetical protein
MSSYTGALLEPVLLLLSNGPEKREVTGGLLTRRRFARCNLKFFDPSFRVPSCQRLGRQLVAISSLGPAVGLIRSRVG